LHILKERLSRVAHALVGKIRCVALVPDSRDQELLILKERLSRVAHAPGRKDYMLPLLQIGEIRSCS
jgi:hypothetical protein